MQRPLPVRAATTTSADKIGVAASDLQIINQNQVANTSQVQTVTLMSTTFNTSTQEDLVISVNAECGVYTAVGANGGGGGSTTSSTAIGSVVIWLTLDGKPLPTTLNQAIPTGTIGDPNANPPTTGNGPVVFCNRAFGLKTANLPLNQMLALFINTRDANSFTWFALNVGNGSHTMVVHASLVASTSSSGTLGGSGSVNLGFVTPAASAIVGQRTLVVVPAHLQNSASF